MTILLTVNIINMGVALVTYVYTTKARTLY